MNIKDTNYITIQGWMRTELDLKGNDLLVYALIYGFCQTENQRFGGSLQYIADWCGATKQGIVNNLQNLISKGLIIKESRIIHGVNSVEYYTTEFNGGIKLSLTNNTNNINKKENTKVFSQPKAVVQETLFDDSKIEIPKTPRQNLFIRCATYINEYTEDEEVREKLKDYLGIRLERKDTPLGFKAFQGMLKKLRELTDSKEECLKIIQQSIDRSYLSFFPVREYKGYNKKTDKSVETTSLHGEQAVVVSKEEKEELRRLVESGDLEEY